MRVLIDSRKSEVGDIERSEAIAALQESSIGHKYIPGKQGSWMFGIDQVVRAPMLAALTLDPRPPRQAVGSEVPTDRVVRYSSEANGNGRFDSGGQDSTE